MTNGKLTIHRRYRKRRPKKLLQPLMKLIIAKELVAGRSMKAVAFDHNLSRSTVQKIREDYCDVLLVLKEEYRDQQQLPLTF